MNTHRLKQNQQGKEENMWRTNDMKQRKRQTATSKISINESGGAKSNDPD